jgi:hypothetical protein
MVPASIHVSSNRMRASQGEPGLGILHGLQLTRQRHLSFQVPPQSRAMETQQQCNVSTALRSACSGALICT